MSLNGSLNGNGKQYKSIVETASDYIFLVDYNNKILSANNAALIFLNRKVDKIIGVSILELFHEEYSLEFVKNIQKVFKEGIEISEISCLIVNDIKIWLSTKLAPMKNSEGKIVSVMGISRDITKHINIEQEKIETLKNVTAGISHDLRNLLSTINSASYILKSLSGAKEKKALNIIDKSVSAMDTMLRNFTEFEKEITLTLKKTDINNVIKETLELVTIPDNIQVITKYDNKINLNLDKNKIIRSLMNILQNSVQAMADGGKLEVTTQRNNIYYAIVIKDTGLGISSKDMKKMFTPFFSTKEGGIGLGLLNTKRIIESHKGTIKIESIKDKGTTITIKLPLT